MRFSNSGSTASGVTSRPVKPVPPVEMMTSIALSAIQVRICSRIFSTSSVTMARPATAWPAFSIRSAKRVARLVVRRLARVGHRQHRDLERHEGALVVDAGHGGAIIAWPTAKVLQALTVPSLKPVDEPALALLGAAVGEAVRHHGALRSPLQRIVADRGRRLQRRVDVARIEELVLRLGVVRPDAGEAVGLQLDHAPAVWLDCARSPEAALRLLHLGQDAEQVLHVMADLMRDHIGLRELAGLAGAAAEAPSRDRGRTRCRDRPRGRSGNRTAPSRSAPRRRPSASGPRTSRASARDRSGLPWRRYPSTCTSVLPRTRATNFPVSSLGVPVRRAVSCCGALRLLVAAAIADDDVGAVDQQPRIDAERPADQAEHHHAADAEPAGADRQPPIPPPPPKPPPSPRRSSTLPLSGMSSRRIAILRRPTRQLLPGVKCKSNHGSQPRSHSRPNSIQIDMVPQRFKRKTPFAR